MLSALKEHLINHQGITHKDSMEEPFRKCRRCIGICAVKRIEVSFMKLVIQVVDEAKVEVDGSVTGQIGKGFMVLVGVGQNDTESDAEFLAKKMVNLRIFDDANGKTNLSLADVGGDVLSVSQFTLFADCSHGRRPSFIYAGAPDKAKRLYKYFNEIVSSLTEKQVQTGIFGADMKVSLVNNGPFTIILDSKECMK